MKNVFYLSFIFAILFISCNSDDNSSQGEQELEENFYALKIGNNWTYEYFVRNSQSDEFETLGIIEEVLITETTIINEETYFTFQSTTTGNESNFPFAPENGITNLNVRDSIGFLITSDHTILYSNEIFEDYLIADASWGNIYGVLKENLQEINVPAGTFNCKQNEIYALLEPDDEISLGRDLIYYSDGIGEIFREYSSVSNPEHQWEKKLIAFEILE